MFHYKVCSLNVLSDVHIPVFKAIKIAHKHDLKITLSSNFINKDFQELNFFDTYKSLKVLKDLDLNEDFKQLSEHILQ